MFSPLQRGDYDSKPSKQGVVYERVMVGRGGEYQSEYGEDKKHLYGGKEEALGIEHF